MCVLEQFFPTIANDRNAVVDWIPTESTPGAVFGDGTFFGFREQLFFNEGVKLCASAFQEGNGGNRPHLCRPGAAPMPF